MTKLQYYYSWELLNSFLSNFDCFSISVLTRWNYSLLFQADCRSSWLPLYGPWQWQSLSWRMKFSKHTASFHITYELGQMIDVWRGVWRCTHAKLAPLTPHSLARDRHYGPALGQGQMMEIPLGTHPGTIRITKFHIKTVLILLFLMFEKCWFCENYPPTFITRIKQEVLNLRICNLGLQRLVWGWHMSDEPSLSDHR